MAKRKMTKTMVDKVLHRKLKIVQHKLKTRNEFRSSGRVRSSSSSLLFVV
jgi:hypothetical protein